MKLGARPLAKYSVSRTYFDPFVFVSVCLGFFFFVREEI